MTPDMTPEMWQALAIYAVIIAGLAVVCLVALVIGLVVGRYLEHRASREDNYQAFLENARHDEAMERLVTRAIGKTPPGSRR